MATTQGINLGIGISTQKDTLKAAIEAVQQAKLSVGKKIDLAIIFSSANFAHPYTLKTINDLLGPVPIIGASGLAVISNQGIFKNALAVVLLNLPESIQFHSALVEHLHSKSAFAAGEELGEKLSHGIAGMRRDFGMLFFDGLAHEASSMLSGLQERVGMSFPIIGASASDNLQFAKTYIYSNQKVTNDAVCGIIWGGKLNFSFGIKHGWKPLGKPRQITKAKANIIYEIEGQPAAAIYEDYLALKPEQLFSELRRISTFYPIGIKLTDEKEYLLRNIISIGPDRSLLCQGNVTEGSIIRLMIGTKESCLEAARQAAEEAKMGLPEKKIRLAFVFESASRYLLLGRDIKKELDNIKQVLGEETPLIGIYTYGELAPLKAEGYYGRTHFHNQTITILGLEG